MKTIQPNRLKKHLFWSTLLLLGLSVLLGAVALAAPEEIYLSAGFAHSCAIETDGDIVCWGANDLGQSSVPAGSGPFSQVSAGGGHTCGLETDGDVVCWGADDLGQSSVPAGSGPFSQVSAGGGHTCGLETDGDIVCWGINDWGQTDVPAGSGPFSQVSAGPSHTCAVETDGDVACWGDDRGGQVSGINFLDAGPFSQVSTGEWHSCALETDGDVVCWGRFSGTGDPFTSPPRPGFSQVSVGDFNQICGVKTDGQVVCWERHRTTDLTIPVALDPVSQVSVGAFFACALETDGDVVCWGENEYGQTDVPADSGPFGPATGYDFDGFFSPIDNMPTVNSVKAGQAIPVKFSLNGDQGMAILAEGYPVSQEIDCNDAAPINEVEEETGSAGNSGLSYDPATDQYSYKWKTDKGWSGACRQLIVQFDDGSVYSALFQFK